METNIPSLGGDDRFRKVGVVGLLVISLFIILSTPIITRGGSLPDFWESLFYATVGSPVGLSRTLVETTPILITAIGIILAFKAGIWNIGAEGQIAVGALAASTIIYSNLTLPVPIMVLSTFFFAFIAAGIYGLIAGLLKTLFDINEILSTLMLNFIALQILTFAALNIWQASGGFPFASPIPGDLHLPAVSGIHIGVLFAVALLALIAYLVHNSKFGFELIAHGENKEAARISGINSNRLTLYAFFLSSGIAGLVGVIQLLGVNHRIEPGITGPNYGYLAIAAALLARENFKYLPLASLLIGVLLAAEIALSAAVAGGVQLFVIGILLLGILALQKEFAKK